MINTGYTSDLFVEVGSVRVRSVGSSSKIQLRRRVIILMFHGHNSVVAWQIEQCKKIIIIKNLILVKQDIFYFAILLFNSILNWVQSSFFSFPTQLMDCLGWTLVFIKFGIKLRCLRPLRGHLIQNQIDNPIFYMG